MAFIPVTPIAGYSSVVPIGGSAVIAVQPNQAGCTITNPIDPADQGLVTAEPLYVDPVASCGLEANGTTFRLEPGQSFTGTPGSTKPVYVNAASDGHKFTVTSWNEANG